MLAVLTHLHLHLQPGHVQTNPFHERKTERLHLIWSRFKMHGQSCNPQSSSNNRMYFTFLIPNLSLVDFASLCFPSTFATCSQFSPDLPIFEAFSDQKYHLQKTWIGLPTDQHMKSNFRSYNFVQPTCGQHIDEMWMVCMICIIKTLGI